MFPLETDKQYDKLIREVREFYDKEVKSGMATKLTIKERDGKLVGFEIVKDKPIWVKTNNNIII